MAASGTKPASFASSYLSDHDLHDTHQISYFTFPPATHTSASKYKYSSIGQQLTPWHVQGKSKKDPVKNRSETPPQSSSVIPRQSLSRPLPSIDQLCLLGSSETKEAPSTPHQAMYGLMQLMIQSLGQNQCQRQSLTTWLGSSCWRH